jgi:hypothetical protein
LYLQHLSLVSISEIICRRATSKLGEQFSGEKESVMVEKSATLKNPIAFIPIIMSSIALAIVLVQLALFGVVHQADEGTAAHIWQLLMALQFPFIAFFAIRYIPIKPREAMFVLALQLIAALAACAPVFFFKL